jgi:hypothetical protein
MNQPEISFHGLIEAKFPVLLQATELAKKIRKGEVEPTRKMCYSTKSISRYFFRSACSRLGIKKLTAEVFLPDRQYPPHTDEGGVSVMVPIEPGCTATINGTRHKLIEFGIYSFDDGVPHTTTGALVMIKPEPEKKRTSE